MNRDILANFAMAEVVGYNPVVHDVDSCKSEYLRRLEKYLQLGGWQHVEFSVSKLEAYKKTFLESHEVEQERGIEYYKNFILFDLIHILGYDYKYLSADRVQRIVGKYLADFESATCNSYRNVVNAMRGVTRCGNVGTLQRLMLCGFNGDERDYLERIKNSVEFRNLSPCEIVVTATMSAGKSTLVNALTGKHVCLSQNLACTSKIRAIINKSCEDECPIIYDHRLVTAAGTEDLLLDSAENSTNIIYVATCFRGGLAGKRFVINDSPGVNFSGDMSHRVITDNLIKQLKYNLLVYVINSSQIGTNDDQEHLRFVKRVIGNTPVVFLMNKIDALNPDEENVFDIVERQRSFLKNIGFVEPVICPVSARAGYLAKKNMNSDISRSERRELYSLVDKFDRLGLPVYYEEKLNLDRITDVDDEERQLLKTCGITYVEAVLTKYAYGGGIVS